MQPCCLDAASKDAVHVKADCCSESTKSQKSSDSEEKGKSCSPFFSCCAGAGFVFAQQLKHKNGGLSAMYEKGSFVFKNNYSFNWYGQIFQPPQRIV